MKMSCCTCLTLLPVGSFPEPSGNKTVFYAYARLRGCAESASPRFPLLRWSYSLRGCTPPLGWTGWSGWQIGRASCREGGGCGVEGEWGEEKEAGGRRNR